MVLHSYMSQREIIIPADQGMRSLVIGAGIPQSSVLGPTLWNVLYDGMISLDLPPVVELVAFADDLTIRVYPWSPHKTEAIMFLERRVADPVISW